jgi:tetratricopeptide (TPR) repeat protein
VIILVLLLGQTPIDFADHLYATGDYKRAALEYERIGFADPDDTVWTPYAILRAGEALLKSGDYERAANVYEFGIKNVSTRWEYFQYGYMRAEFSDSGYPAVKIIAPRLKASEFAAKSSIYLAFADIYSGHPDSGLVILAGLEPNPLVDEAISVLGTQPKRRSPWLSAGFSTLLPGAGQAYCGRWADAWQSLSITGIFAAAAVYYGFFSHDTTAGNTIKIAVTASLGGLFWLGNIYGAANAALDYNDYEKRKKDEQFAQIFSRFDLEPDIKRP